MVRDKWREIAAAALEIGSSVVTQFSPAGFREAIGSDMWFFVKLGPLVLRHDGTWTFTEQTESCEARLKYAYATPRAALVAMRAVVVPDVPAMAEMYERVYKNV